MHALLLALSKAVQPIHALCCGMKMLALVMHDSALSPVVAGSRFTPVLSFALAYRVKCPPKLFLVLPPQMALPTTVNMCVILTQSARGASRLSRAFGARGCRSLQDSWNYSKRGSCGRRKMGLRHMVVLVINNAMPGRDMLVRELLIEGTFCCPHTALLVSEIVF